MSDEQNREDVEYGLKELNGSAYSGEGERNPINPSQPQELTDAQGRKLCGAKKRNGGVCRAKSMPNGRCRLHGGLTPSGIASPHFKHGRRSKYIRAMPKTMRRAYLAALNDKDLLALDDETALLTARITKLLQDISDTKAPPWGKAVDALVSFEQANRSKDKDKAKRMFGKLVKVIRQGADVQQREQETWAEIMEVINLKTHTASAELKRQVVLGDMVPVEKMVLFITVFMETVRTAAQEHLDKDSVPQGRELAGRVVSDVAKKIYSMLPSAPMPTVIDNGEEIQP